MSLRFICRMWVACLCWNMGGCSLVIDPLALNSQTSEESCRASCSRLGLSGVFCEARCTSSDPLGNECLRYCEQHFVEKSAQDPWYLQGSLRRSLCGTICSDFPNRKRCWDGCLSNQPPPSPPTAPPTPPAPIGNPPSCEKYHCGPSLPKTLPPKP